MQCLHSFWSINEVILFKWSAWLTPFRHKYIQYTWIAYIHANILSLQLNGTPFYLYARITIIFGEIKRERVTPTYARARITLNHLVSFYTYTFYPFYLNTWMVYLLHSPSSFVCPVLSFALSLIALIFSLDYLFSVEM